MFKKIWHDRESDGLVRRVPIKYITYYRLVTLRWKLGANLTIFVNNNGMLGRNWASIIISLITLKFISLILFKYVEGVYFFR